MTKLMYYWRRRKFKEYNSVPANYSFFEGILTRIKIFSVLFVVAAIAIESVIFMCF